MATKYICDVCGKEVDKFPQGKYVINNMREICGDCRHSVNMTVELLRRNNKAFSEQIQEYYDRIKFIEDNKELLDELLAKEQQ